MHSKKTPHQNQVATLYPITEELASSAVKGMFLFNQLTDCSWKYLVDAVSISVKKTTLFILGDEVILCHS